MILMKSHTFFYCQKLGKMLQNMSSVAVAIGTFRVNSEANNFDRKKIDCFLASFKIYVVATQSTVSMSWLL